MALRGTLGPARGPLDRGGMSHELLSLWGARCLALVGNQRVVESRCERRRVVRGVPELSSRVRIRTLVLHTDSSG